MHYVVNIKVIDNHLECAMMYFSLKVARCERNGWSYHFNANTAGRQLEIWRFKTELATYYWSDWHVLFHGT